MLAIPIMNVINQPCMRLATIKSLKKSVHKVIRHLIPSLYQAALTRMRRASALICARPERLTRRRLPPLHHDYSLFSSHSPPHTSFIAQTTCVCPLLEGTAVTFAFRVLTLALMVFTLFLSCSHFPYCSAINFDGFCLVCLARATTAGLKFYFCHCCAVVRRCEVVSAS